MAIDLVRDLWDYHHWANRRLFEATAAAGEQAAEREIGKQFSVPTLRGMLTHIYGADRWWLGHWTGHPPTGTAGASMFYGYDPGTLAELRVRWDELEAEQRRFFAGLGDADLSRVVEGRGRLGSFRIPLGVLVLHVANHATHHRSEIATMLTIVSGSPADTGMISYYTEKTGQRRS